MFRSIAGNINGLGGVLSAGKWTVEVAPPPESGWLSSGEDVSARVRSVREWVRSKGGVVTNETNQWTTSNVDIEFTLPGSSNWDLLWAIPEKDLTFTEGIRDAIKEESRETIDYADLKAQERLAEAQRRAEAASLQANLDAQRTVADADSRAEARILQGSTSTLLVTIAGLSIAAVIYITVSPSKAKR